MAENSDGRWEPYVPIYVSVVEHRKTLAFRRMLGLGTRREALGVLVALWLFTLKNAWQDGDLGKYAVEDIEEDLEWEGEAGEMVRALTEAGFLDKHRKVNDWAAINKRLIDGRVGRRERYERTKAPANGARPYTPRTMPDPRARAAKLAKERGIA